MKIQLRHDQMEEIEGLHSRYPYAYHHVDVVRTVIPWHWHEALEFNYVVRGSMKVSTPGSSRVFTKGQGFFINSNVLSTVVNLQDCVLDSHLFHPVLLGGHYDSVFATKYLQPITQNRHLDMVPLTGETLPQKNILQMLKQLALIQQQPDGEFRTRNLLSEIWLELLEEVRHLETHTTGPQRDRQERVQTMMAFIQEHYAERLTLEDIALSAAISTRECLRAFKGAIGQTPMEYLTAYRVRQGKKLLETTSLPVTEIALQTGFNSPAYFTKVFRQHTDQTPVEFRKNK